MTPGIVTLRKVNGQVLGFTLPVHVARKLNHLLGKQFTAELVPEGVLFRVLTEEPAPAWARGD